MSKTVKLNPSLVNTVQNKLGTFMCTLAERYRTERAYEKWSEYDASLRRAFEKLPQVKRVVATFNVARVNGKLHRNAITVQWVGSDDAMRATVYRRGTVQTVRMQ